MPIIDASRLEEYKPITKESLLNFERVFHFHKSIEKAEGSSGRNDVLNTTDTLGSLLKYIAFLESK